MVAQVYVLRTNSSSKKGVIRLKGVRVKLEHSWSKAGKLRKYFMPKQHVASLKSHYAIPLFKVKDIYGKRPGWVIAHSKKVI